MKKLVFDQEVLGLSYRKANDRKHATRVFCSRVVVTSTGVEAYIKSKNLDILVCRIPLEAAEVPEIEEYENEILIRTKEYRFTILRNYMNFAEPTEDVYEAAWEKI